MPRIVLRVEAEAVSMDLPRELALDIYRGILADDIEDWDENKFLAWTYWMEEKHQLGWDDWYLLYGQVSDILIEFSDLL